VDQRSSLLSQLRIDRPDEPKASSGFRWALAGIALVAVAAAAVAGWYFVGPPSRPVVTFAVAETVTIGTASSRGSALDASGYIVARRQATVSAKVTGKVVEVLIEEGQQVETNQVVARLDATNARAALAQAAAQLEQARANLAASQVAFDNTVPMFDRNRAQFAERIISAQDFDTAKASYDAAATSLEVAKRAVDVAAASLEVAERNLDDTIVRAPFTGIVTVKAAQEGEMVSPISAGGGFTRTGIGTIVDMDSLEVQVDVSESFINRVYPEQDVVVTLNAYPDWRIPAHVIAIIPTADRAKATVRVRVGLDEKDSRILPEMGVRVSFLDEETLSATGGPPARTAVVIPADAVQANGNTGVVYVIRDNVLERRAVSLGRRTPDGQIVLSGLGSGARVAVGSSAELADGARIRVAGDR
jgi:RND family efflux transporter MFP subunit